jgi:O-antigen/teichoic acid export membrane protein
MPKLRLISRRRFGEGVVGKRFRNYLHLELKYVYSGFASSIVAAVFSIVYSKDLGAQNRGIVTAILLANMFFSSVLSGGVNITYKSHRGIITAAKHFVAYLQFSLLHTVLTTLLVSLSLLIYSNLKNEIPEKLLYLTVGYTIACTFITQTNQLLISFSKIKLKLKYDFLVVTIQPLFYIILKFQFDITPASAVLLSFTFSYLLITSLIILHLLPSLKKINTRVDSLSRGSLKDLIKQSASIRSFSILTALTDRFDRIIVLILFSASEFGVYSFAIGFIAFFRFLPDSISNLIMSKNSKLSDYLESRLTPLRALFTFFASTAAAITIASLIPRYMGEEWRISSLTLAIYFYSEILRGLYIVRVTSFFSINKDKTPFRSILAIILVTIVGVFFLKGFLGVSSVPFALFLGYCVSLLYLSSIKRRVQRT